MKPRQTCFAIISLLLCSAALGDPTVITVHADQVVQPVNACTSGAHADELLLKSGLFRDMHQSRSPSLRLAVQYAPWPSDIRDLVAISLGMKRSV